MLATARDGEGNWLRRNGNVALTLLLTLCACGVAGMRVASQPSEDRPADHADWPVYGGSEGNSKYSKLAQINVHNVASLKEAWRFDSNETGGLETTPIIIGNVLYAYTPRQEVIALDGASGKLLWKFDSQKDFGAERVASRAERGLSYWQSGDDRRILAGISHYVYAINAADGTIIRSFANNGRIDLRENLRGEPKTLSVSITSPGAIYKDLIILGDATPESLPAPPGDIRAYDVRTGKLRWSFHTIPHPGEFGYDTWPKDAWKTSGAANNWAGMTVDTARGIVYVPTGSAAFDFYGADRVGDDLFANCLIALNAETGERIWHFQGVKHDMWDRDFPAPPVLVTVDRDGKKVDAVAQTSKQGFVFLFDRTNGKPLFPLDCRKYPASNIPGEVAAQQQCLPAKPAPFARQLLTEDLLSERTPEVHKWALEKFRSFRSEGQFVPFSVGKDTVVFPGFDGGAEWGGAAADPETGILYVNANDLPWTGALAENTSENTPQALYLNQCAVCHGEKMAGSPPAIPALTALGGRMSSSQVLATIKNGKGRMPGFSNLDDDELYALLAYVMSGGKETGKEVESAGPPSPAMNYHFTGYHRFYDPDGYPAVVPPWGTLNAINLNTGEYVWKIPLGEYPELAAEGVKNTGTENYGGPLVTAGGLLFIGATNFDKKFRAFDKTTGALLWETTLPFSANTTPASYEVNGRQFVVIAAGGGKDPKSKSGGVYVAFALKK